MFNSFFLWGWLHRNIIFNLGEMNFSVSSPRPTKKTCVFLCVYFFFLCGLTHRKIIFNLGEHNFSVRVRPTENLFLTDFLWFYFCVLFSDGTPSEKIFFRGYLNFSVGFFTHRNIRVSSSGGAWIPIMVRIWRGSQSLFLAAGRCTLTFVYVSSISTCVIQLSLEIVL